MGQPPPDSHLFRTARDGGGAHLAVEALHQLPGAVAHQGGATEDLVQGSDSTGFQCTRCELCEDISWHRVCLIET